MLIMLLMLILIISMLSLMLFWCPYSSCCWCWWWSCRGSWRHCYCHCCWWWWWWWWWWCWTTVSIRNISNMIKPNVVREKWWGLNGDILGVSEKLQIGQKLSISVNPFSMLLECAANTCTKKQKQQFRSSLQYHKQSILDKQNPTASKSTTVSAGILAASMSTSQMIANGGKAAGTRTTARTSKTNKNKVDRLELTITLTYTYDN